MTACERTNSLSLPGLPGGTPSDRPRAEPGLEALGVDCAAGGGHPGVVEEDAGPAGERVGDVG